MSIEVNDLGLSGLRGTLRKEIAVTTAKRRRALARLSLKVNLSLADANGKKDRPASPQSAEKNGSNGLGDSQLRIASIAR